VFRILAVFLVFRLLVAAQMPAAHRCGDRLLTFCRTSPVPMCCLDVQLHSHTGERSASDAERINNLPMLAAIAQQILDNQILSHVRGCLGRLIRQGAHRAKQHVEDGPQGLFQPAVPGGVENQQMEASVCLGKLPRAAGAPVAGNFFHRGILLLESQERRFLDVPGSVLGRNTFEAAANFIQLLDISLRDTRDACAAAGAYLQQPFGAKAAQGIVDRRAADTQSRRNVLLDKQGTLRNLPADDAATQMFIHKLACARLRLSKRAPCFPLHASSRRMLANVL
jgi:hypothetical protein